MKNVHKPLLHIPTGYENVLKLDADLKVRDEDHWINRGEIRVLRLFHEMYERVPAYNNFIKQHKINPRSIKTITDFKSLPLLNKENYLNKYPIEDMCWDGDFSGKGWTLSTNSGSTGQTYYFPRLLEHDKQYAIEAELYLRNNFRIQDRTTLYINTFAMGAWIGGVFTFEAIRIVANKGYSLSIINPGIFKDEVFKIVRSLGHKFDQIIIGGYPPMVKDIVDQGIALGIDWKKYLIGFVFSAEGFSEDFRDYLYERCKISNVYKASLNHYGTADMGTMAHETPLCNLIKRTAVKDSDLLKSLFKEKNRIPTFAQYFPELFYFEDVSNVLVCSGYSGLPFVRYDLKDYGGLLKLSELREVIGEKNFAKLILDADIRETVWNIPFVYLYERNDFVLKLYGANIYPESVRGVLQKKAYENYITGKFSMEINMDDRLNQYLQINIELKDKMKSTVKLMEEIQSSLIKSLLEDNSEYASNYKSNKRRQVPRIQLLKYGDERYFKTGGKQKWIIR